MDAAILRLNHLMELKWSSGTWHGAKAWAAGKPKLLEVVSQSQRLPDICYAMLEVQLRSIKRYAHFLRPGTVDVVSLGIGVFADVIKSGWAHSEWSLTLHLTALSWERDVKMQKRQRQAGHEPHWSCCPATPWVEISGSSNSKTISCCGLNKRISW